MQQKKMAHVKLVERDEKLDFVYQRDSERDIQRRRVSIVNIA